MAARDLEEEAQPPSSGASETHLLQERLPCVARVDRVLPGSVVGDSRHAAPAELDVVDRHEPWAAVVELVNTADAIEGVTVALGDVDVRTLRLHPGPPPFLPCLPRLVVGLDRDSVL